MTNGSHYIIRGGDPGAERLRVLSLAMRSGSLTLLDRAGLAPGLHVLDLGCGSGDITVDVARLTLLNIADAAIAGGYANRAEIDGLLAELAKHEADPRSIQSTAQVFQVIGRRS